MSSFWRGRAHLGSAAYSHVMCLAQNIFPDVLPFISLRMWDRPLCSVFKIFTLELWHQFKSVWRRIKLIFSKRILSTKSPGKGVSDKNRFVDLAGCVFVRLDYNLAVFFLKNILCLNNKDYFFRYCWLISTSVLGIGFSWWCYKHPESDVMRNELFFIWFLLFFFFMCYVIITECFSETL